jgi:serine protease Do
MGGLCFVKSWLLGLLVLSVCLAPVRASDDVDSDAAGFTKSRLGIIAAEISNDRLDALGLSWGVLVEHVISNSAAQRADLRAGDILLSLDGEATYSPGRLEWLIRKHGVRTSLRAEIYRRGNSLKKEIELSDGATKPDLERGAFAILQGLFRSIPELSVEAGSSLGLAVYPMTAGLRQQLGAAPHIGLLVVDVIHEGPADKAGIRPGDVLSRIEETTLASLSDVHRALSGVEPGDRVEVVVIRSGRERGFSVTTAEKLDRAKQRTTSPLLLVPWGWWYQGVF